MFGSLVALHVEDFALIDRLELLLEPGLNVFTGETGTGKSILIDAMAAVLGERTPPEMVRSGAGRARVEALFDVAGLPDLRREIGELGLGSEEDGELTLARELQAEGRTLCRANGRPVPLATLRRLAGRLVELQGQHAHQGLLHPDNHRDWLDAFGGDEHRGLRARVAGHYEGWRQVRRERQALQAELAAGRAREWELETLRHQLREIEEAGIRPGEEAELLQLRRRLQHAGRLLESAGRAYEELYGGEAGVPPIADRLALLAADLEQAAAFDEGLRPLAEQVQSASLQAQEVARDLRRYRQGLEFDPQELEGVERRVEQLRELQRKHGRDEAGLLALAGELRARMERLEEAGERLAELERREEALLGELAEAAAALRASRAELASRVGPRLEEELALLGMGGARVAVRIEGRPAGDGDGVPLKGAMVQVDRSGADRVEFLLAANPGEPFWPLQRVASGGEMARLLLALRGLFAAAGGPPTLILDEVDAGIGGQTGLVVGQRLRSLGDRLQVLCVTHLAQVASQAPHHFALRKEVAGGRTATRVERLTGEARVREVARMLAGSAEGSAVEHARELLARQGF